MFQHVFAEMNNMLDEIVKHYPTAQEAQKHQLIQKWNLLKTMSDGIIEEWLSFEEKMGAFREQAKISPVFPQHETPEVEMDSFIRGQGYFKLLMYRQAAQQFAQVILEFPDSFVARMYLAMAYLHLEEAAEARHHFQWILPLAQHPKLKAMVLNALGCVEAMQGELGKAQDYFTLALSHDPSSPDPLMNLQVCQQQCGQLQYGSQLISLM